MDQRHREFIPRDDIYLFNIGEAQQAWRCFGCRWIEELKEFGVDFTMVERNVLLKTVDRNWIDHIDAMDQLRKGISLRAYGQVDPVISYKKEGYDMFDEMIERIQRTTISILLKVKIQVQAAPPAPVQPAPAPAQPAQPASPAPARPANPAPVYRRQMPEPLSNMSSSQNKND